MRATRMLRVSILAVLAAGIFSPALAAPLTWDGTVNGNWDTATLNWQGGATFADGDAVTFDDTAAGTHAVSVVGTVSPLSVTVDTGSSYTFSGGTLAGTSGGLIKNGAGTLILGPSNTYTGATTVNAGILQLSGVGSLGSTSGVAVVSGAALDLKGAKLSSAKTVTIAGAGPTGQGALVNTGAGVADYGLSVILSADATVGGTARFDIGWGGTTLNGGGFALTKTGVGYVDIRGAVSNLAALNVDQGYLYFESAQSGMGSTVTTVNSGGVLGIYGGSTINTQLVLNGGTIGQFGPNNTATGTWSGGVTVAAGSTISTKAAPAWTGGNVSMTGAFTGTAGLSIAGPYTVTLGGANTGYSGAITVQSGSILKAGSTTALGVGGVTVASGATLDTNGQNFVDGVRPNITIAGTGTTGQGALINNTAYSDIGSLTLTGDAKVNVNGQLDTFGQINGPGFVLTKTGTGECMAIRGGVGDLGGLVVEQGRVRIENAALGAWTGPVTVKTGGTLSQWSSGSNSAAIRLEGGTIEDEAGGTATWNGTVTVVSDSFIAKNTGSMVLNGAVSGSGKITSAGGYTLTLNAASPGFTGAIDLTGGILRLGNSGALGLSSGITVAAGATLDFAAIDMNVNYRNYTIAGTGAAGQSGALVNSGSTARLQNLTLSGNAKIHNNGRMDIFGPINGPGYVLTKTGTGDCLAIRGGVTALGGLIVEQGKVRLENAALSGWTGPVTVKPGGILTHWGNGSNSASIILEGGTLADEWNGTATFNGPVAINSDSFVSTGGGNVVLNGALSGNGGVAIDGGYTASVNVSGSVGSIRGGSKLALGSGATLTAGSNGASTTYTGLISGQGALAKTGTGVLTLANTGNTYAGGTTVGQGTLISAGPGTLGSGTVTLSGGTLVASPGAALSGFGGNGMGWTLNGGATVAGDVVTLTTAGGSQRRSIFYNAVIPTNGFEIEFTYSASDKTSGDPADGMVVVFQNDPRGTAALGDSGGARGYGGSTLITPSAGIGFNIYPPGGQGISSIVYTNGSMGGGNTSISPLAIYGTPFDVRLTYDYAAKSLTALLTQGGNTFTRTYAAVDLPAILGGVGAYFGFTGGTGGANAVQTVSNLTYNSSAASAYANDLQVVAGATGNVHVLASATGADVTMGNLAMGTGATLSLAAASGSAADIDYSLTLGATSLAGPATFDVANNGAGMGTLELGAVSGDASASLTKTGAGTLVLSGANSYQGETAIAGGTLALVTAGTNNIASSPVIDVRGGAMLDVTGVAGGFTLAGTQFLKGNGTVVGDLTGSAGSTLSAGSSPGALTIQGAYDQGGGTLLAELAGYDQGAATATGYDWIFVDGQATLGGLIVVDLIDGFLPYEGSVFTILTAANGITNVDFSGIQFEFDHGPAGTYSYAPRFVETNGGMSLQLEVVPEPISLTLLGLASMGLGGYVRRRRR